MYPCVILARGTRYPLGKCALFTEFLLPADFFCFRTGLTLNLVTDDIH